MFIKENSLPDWQEVITQEIYNILQNNHISADVYDDYDFRGSDDAFVLCVEINNGDWKHEHKRADNIVVDTVDNYDNMEITKIGEETIGDSEDDTYSSIHRFHILRYPDDNGFNFDDIEQLDIKFPNKESLNHKSRKSVKESIDLSDYKFKFCQNGYKIYSKMENGKGVWAAVPVIPTDDDNEPFEISYDQARGFEPINPIDAKVQHTLKKALKMESVYTDNGYRNRADYLKSLADDYGVPLTTVKDLASILGPEEDFDGLVTEIEDIADEYDDYNDEETLTGLDWFLNEYEYVIVSDEDFMEGYHKIEEAEHRVAQLLICYNCDVTLYNDVMGTKTAYDHDKIDYSELEHFDYDEDDWNYPDVLIVKSVGGSDAVDNVRKVLKMAEVETKKINESCTENIHNKEDNDRAYGRYKVKFTPYENMFKFDYIDDYFDKSDYCFFDKSGYVNTDYSGITKNLFNKLYDKGMKPNKVYKIYTDTPHGEVLYYEEVPSHWFK